MINDNKKKESKRIFPFVLIFYAFTLFSILIMYIKDEFTRDGVFLILFFFLAFTFFFYCWISADRYQLEINNETITEVTLFKAKEIFIRDITGYKYKRYSKSEFYIFTLFVEKHKYIIDTRYRDELIKLLNEKGVAEV